MSLPSLLKALLAATPPPDRAADPVLLLEQAEQIVKARAPLMDELANLIRQGASLAGVASLAEELADHDKSWQAALSCARDTVSERIRNLRRMRVAAR